MTASETRAAERARRDEEKLAALVARDFPERLLKPWRSRVRRELGRRWEAGMLPLVGGPESDARWTLRLQRPYVQLHDDDQDVLLSRAIKVDALLSREARG